MNKPEATLNFPEHWVTEPWMHTEVISVVTKDDDGTRAYIAGGVLNDGTNLMGLAYPGGQRVMRAGPATGWAIEEHFSGRPLREGPDDGLLEMWKNVVEASVYGKHAAEAELGRRLS